MDKVKLARVDCENECAQKREGSQIVSAALVGRVKCPFCGKRLHAVESYESALVESMTEPDESLGLA